MRLGIHIYAILLFLCTITLNAQQASDFTVTDVNGNSHNLYDDYLNTEKMVVLFIMHRFNPGSNAIASDLQKLYKSWGSGEFGVQFIGLSNKAADTDAVIKEFNSLYKIEFPMISAEGGSVQVAEKLLQSNFISPPLFIIVKDNKDLIYDVKGEDNAETLKVIDGTLVQTGVIKPFLVQGKISAGKHPAQNVTINISGVDNEVTTTYNSITNEQGLYEYVFEEKPSSDEVAFVPYKNHDFDNGLSTLDIVGILRHLLRSKVFNQPEDYYRADIDRSGTVSALDVVALRRILLQIDTSFKNNTSWRFLPSDYKFINPNSPFKENAPEWISIADIEQRFIAPDFNAIKVGDMNQSANPNLLDGQIRNNFKKTLDFEVEENQYTVSYHFKTKDLAKILGLQLGFNYDELSITNPIIKNGELHFDHSAYGDFNAEKAGKIYISWNDIIAQDIDPNSPLFTITFDKLSGQNLGLGLDSDRLKPEIYDQMENTFAISLSKSKIENSIVFPNPTSEKVVLTFGEIFSGTLKILNGSGQIIQEFPLINTNKKQINLEQLQSGIYLFQLESEFKLPVTHKIVKL